MCTRYVTIFFSRQQLTVERLLIAYDFFERYGFPTTTVMNNRSGVFFLFFSNNEILYALNACVIKSRLSACKQYRRHCTGRFMSVDVLVILVFSGANEHTLI